MVDKGSYTIEMILWLLWVNNFVFLFYIFFDMGKNISDFLCCYR